MALVSVYGPALFCQKSGVGQLVCFVLFPKNLLVKLADAGLRHCRNKDNIVGQVHAWEARTQVFVDFFLGERVLEVGLGHHERQWALLPLGVRTAMTAASSTLGWPMMAFSKSWLEIHSPPLLTRSLVRSTI